MPDQSELLWNRCPFSRRLKFNFIISLDCYFLRDEKLFGAIIESNEWICMRDFVFVGADVSGRSINVERNERSSSIDRQRPYTCTRRNTWSDVSAALGTVMQQKQKQSAAASYWTAQLSDNWRHRMQTRQTALSPEGLAVEIVRSRAFVTCEVGQVWLIISTHRPTQPPSIGQFDLSSSHKVKSHRMIEGMRRSRRPKTFWPQSFLSRRTFALSPWLWLRLRLWL